MADQLGTLERLAIELANTLQPIAGRLGDRQLRQTFAQLGVEFPPELLTRPGVTAARQAVSANAAALPGALDALAAAVEAEDPVAVATKGLDLLGKCAAVVGSFGQLASALQAATPGLPGITAAQMAELVADLPRKLVDLLVVDAADVIPAVGNVLTLLGIIDRTFHPGDPANPTKPEWEGVRVNYDRLGPLVFAPETYLRDRFGWGDPAFDGVALLEALRDFLARMRLPVLLRPGSGGSPPVLEAFAFDLSPTRSGSPPGLDLTVVLPVGTEETLTMPLPHPAWSARLHLGGSFVAGTRGTLRPPLDLSLTPTPETGELAGGVEVTVSGKPAEPFVLLGQAGASRLEVASIAIAAGLTLRWDAAAGQAEGEPVLTGTLTGVRLAVDGSAGDGFVTALLAGIRVEAGFDLDLAWSLATGLRFDGSSSLELELPVNRALGPLSLSSVYLGARLDDGRLPIELSANLGARLGPLDAAVERLGLVLTVSFPSGGGNVGPARVVPAFKPPTGVGLSLDLEGLSGGGFLEIDEVNDRYEGMLQLSFQGRLTLTAFGLITTRMPDGSRGFSLLILISAEFAPIQLGFGFTLNGVGGLLGLNRTVAVEAIRQGLKSNTLDHVLFPRDPLANAPRILSDLRTIFPPRQNQFVIGPMAKIGWGAPTLISIELGLLIELPDPLRIAIVGVLRATLPDPDLALLDLRVNFVGVLDFEAGYLSFDAVLYNSRLVALTLAGAMAVRVRWGERPGFVLSVGGFHPAYVPPPGQALPAVDRLTLSLLPGTNPRITLESYFAITSNTVQFGARIELFAAAGSFNVYGWLGFDALFQLAPFQFVAEASASLAVRAGTTSLFSVTLRFTLRGPSPYNAKGTASFSILFFSFSVRFDVTFGAARDTSVAPVPVLPLLAAAVTEPRNWETRSPRRSSMLVTTRDPGGTGGDVVVHPFGALTVRQKQVPLGVAVQRLGAARIADGERFDITRVAVSGVDLEVGAVRDEFAPAQFFDLSDAEKLARPSFEELPSGVRIGPSDQLEAGTVVTRTVAYEQHIIDARRRRLTDPFILTRVRFLRLVSGSALASSELARRARPAGSALSPDAVALAAEGWTVASTDTLRPVDDAVPAASQTEARARLTALLAADPSLAGKVQVVPSYEVADA